MLRLPNNTQNPDEKSDYQNNVAVYRCMLLLLREFSGNFTGDKSSNNLLPYHPLEKTYLFIENEARQFQRHFNPKKKNKSNSLLVVEMRCQ